MSPDQLAGASALARLRREIAHDRAALSIHAQDARQACAGLEGIAVSRPLQALGAVALHAWYTGFETLVERVVRQLDGAVPRGDAYHRELLFAATTEVPHARPAVIPSSLTDDLIELLSFRHFFRHAYGVELDPLRLRPQLTRLVRVHEQVSQALDAFDDFLAKTQEALATSS